MKIAVGLLTHNVYAGARLDLFEETYQSLVLGFGSAPLVLSNGSRDGTHDLALELGGHAYDPDDGNTSPGRGENILVERLRKRSPDAELVVLSDDDMRWKPEAGEALTRLWRNAPDTLTVVSGLLEPVWPWNTPRFVVDCGGVRVLVRDSVPNAAWTFPARFWSRFGPFKEGFGQDVDACERIRQTSGQLVGQVDLAEHLGRGRSLWGNDAEKYTQPLDRAAWGV